MIANQVLIASRSGMVYERLEMVVWELSHSLLSCRELTLIRRRGRDAPRGYFSHTVTIVQSKRLCQSAF